MQALANWLSIYGERRVVAVMLLGFASGLPYLLTASTLAAWLQESGLDKGTIGTFALVSLPYSLKFLWAPLIDQLKLPWLSRGLGQRRSWLLVTQLATAGAIFSFTGVDPAAEPQTIAWLAVLLAFCSASHDIVVDAFRADYLRETQYGEGASMSLFGYRLGMMAAGAGALALADAMDWQQVYPIMALLMGVGVIATFCVSEPPREEQAPSDKRGWQRVSGWITHAVIAPFTDFMRRNPEWLAILCFIFFYRMPDGFIGFITTAFFLDTGFTKSDIAVVSKLYGFGATLMGMFLGGLLIHKLGLARCLLLFLLFQILANLSYILLTVTGPSIPALMLVISLDNLSGGMAPAAAIAYMMSLCNKQFTATQYALLSSLAALASKTIAGSAGFIAESQGWMMMFIISALLGIPAILLGLRLVKRGNVM